MVRPLGFEPRTCGLRVRCSAIELEARQPNEASRPCWGDRGDLNPRPPGPQPGALTELSYGHHVGRPVWHSWSPGQVRMGGEAKMAGMTDLSTRVLAGELDVAVAQDLREQLDQRITSAPAATI